MQGFKIPKQLATGLFTDIIVPSVGQNGYGAIWNNSTKKIEWAQFETLGAVASGIATHVGLSNPHAQYQLTSGLGSAAFQNTSAFDSAGAATTAINNHIAAANPHTQYPLSSSLGTAAYLNVGTSANNIVQLNGSGFLPALNGSLLTNLPATTPGGSSGYIQYNNAGAFGASGVYWDSVNSRVGIGTASPGFALSVSGTSDNQLSINGDSGQYVSFYFTYGGSARKGQFFYDNTNAIMGFGGAATNVGVKFFYGNGTTAITILGANGNVGIGTTSPSQKLDVNGTVNVATALIVPVVRPASDSTTAWKVTKADGATSVITVDTTNSRVILSSSAPKLAWAGDATSAFSDTLNLSPLAGTNKNGDVVICPSGTATNAVLYLSNNSVPDTSGAMTFAFGSNFAGARIGTWAFGSIVYAQSTTTSRDIGFYVSNSGGRSEVITIKSSNKCIGIQQISPTAWLHLPSSTISAASLCIPSGTAPTSPNSGDLWYDGTNLKFRDGATTRTLTWT